MYISPFHNCLDVIFDNHAKDRMYPITRLYKLHKMKCV